MTKNEFLVLKHKLLNSYEQEIIKISNEYALSNNTINVGDVIESHTMRIKVDKIMVYLGTDFPSCKYEGPLLTKNNAPCKNGRRGATYQKNITKVNP